MKRKLVIAAVAASVVIGGGTAVAFADDEARTGSAEVRAAQPVAADRAEESTAKSSKATAAEVITAALKHTPGTAVGADREDDGADAGTWQVDVVGADGVERTVTVSPDTGKAVHVQRDTDDDADADADDDADRADDKRDDADDAREDLAALKGASVDAHEAALAVAAKGEVTDVDLDDDERATVWSVDTARSGEWQVDVRTGEVTQELDD
ncbi:PepSY domain-containing protein [Streptomyces rishiriensis]|uniref:Membrane protein YkoI n=1 Tax=Streptomyces rishiriensis TaxID=68264 RepID=A0ABU0NWK7_STRRH|nr:PepSY domain-containing protein [Streptomyces rishiriensis]MDQ0583530.1 putative membrane protein YkoI [Streptomyces rishiriensis]